MSRISLLAAASLLALSSQAFAKPTGTVTGGGASLVGGEVGKVGTANTELNLFGDTNFTFVTSGSGSGRNAFITNNQNCNINNVGAYPAACAAGGAAVHYDMTDGGYTTTELAALNNAGTATAQKNSVFGDIIQVPYLGTAIAIPVVNSKVTANGLASLTDADICGIFSGKLTNWNQTSASKKLTAGTIVVAYRSDSSGTTTLFTEHLNAVCNSTNSNFLGTTATTGPASTSTFATILPASATSSPNFVAFKGSQLQASYLSGLVSGTDSNGKTVPFPVTSATGYISPDYTAIATKSAAVLTNGAHSTLPTANVNGKAPNTTNITTALANVSLGTNLTPPANATDAANASLWLPVVQTVSAGYPIVGYVAIQTAQCYATATTASTLTTFLNSHYTVKGYKTIQTNNGFVAIPSAFLTAIQTYILPGTADQGTEISSVTGCAGLAGR